MTRDEIREKLKIYDMIEPKKQNNFYIDFDDILGDGYIVVPLTVECPKIYITEDNEAFWEPIKITFVDPICPSCSQALISLWKTQKWFSDVEGEKNPITQNKVIIRILGPAGEPVSKWVLHNAKVSYIDFGTLDKDSSEKIIVEMVLDYEYAELEF